MRKLIFALSLSILFVTPTAAGCFDSTVAPTSPVAAVGSPHPGRQAKTQARKIKGGASLAGDCDLANVRTATDAIVWVYDSRGGPYILYPAALTSGFPYFFLTCPYTQIAAVADSQVYVSGVDKNGNPIPTHIPSTQSLPVALDSLTVCCPDTLGNLRTVAWMTVHAR